MKVRKIGCNRRARHRQRPEETGPERLARLREAIRSGQYETPEKLELALRNLVADLRRSRRAVGLSRADETGGERP